MINDVPILDAPLIYGANHHRPGIAVGIMHEDGVVPEYEKREAAVFAHLNPSEFRSLDWSEQAQIIAHKRIAALLEQHYQADASRGLT